MDASFFYEQESPETVVSLKLTSALEETKIENIVPIIRFLANSVYTKK